jgi:hypothetical protein
MLNFDMKLAFLYLDSDPLSILLCQWACLKKPSLIDPAPFCPVRSCSPGRREAETSHTRGEWSRPSLGPTSSRPTYGHYRTPAIKVIHAALLDYTHRDSLTGLHPLDCTTLLSRPPCRCALRACSRSACDCGNSGQPCAQASNACFPQLLASFAHASSTFCPETMEFC